MSGGYAAWQLRLESLLKDVDSRVNLCKKILGLEEGAMPNQKFLSAYTIERQQ
jgi:hypothetical protein